MPPAVWKPSPRPGPHSPGAFPGSIPWFECAAALASDTEAAFKAQERWFKVLPPWPMAGPFDIGFQTWSGMLKHGHDVLYGCFDNEAYTNTGIQRYSSAPHAAMNATSPPGRLRMGKRHLKKDMFSIVAAHQGKLERLVLPLYHTDRTGWIAVKKGAISKLAIFFNSHCMMRRYATEAYNSFRRA